MTKVGMTALSFWKERNMTNIITSLLLLFLGDLLVLALTIFLIGFMFLLRVMLNIWFDTDFMKRIVAWCKDIEKEQKHRQYIRREKKAIKEAESLETWVIEREKDVPEQK